MRVGIIAEGRGDLAVISNILRGCLNIDGEDIQFLRPEYAYDQTDLHYQPESSFGNWLHVKNECTDGSRIDEFLNSPLDEVRLLVIHIDTDVAHESGFDVERPPSAPHLDYVAELRQRVATKLDEWLDEWLDDKHVQGSISYAIAVQQTDAWVLTLHTRDQHRQTSTWSNPKNKLHETLNRQLSRNERNRLFQQKAGRRYDQLSRGFRKHKQLSRSAKRNHSLQTFIRSLQTWRNEQSFQ